MPRYRYRTRALIGPWRDSQDQALEDATAAKQVRFESEEPPRIRWLVPGEIEEEEEAGGEQSRLA